MTKYTLLAATAAMTLALNLPVFAHDAKQGAPEGSAMEAAAMENHPEGMHIHDVYARTNGGIGKTGAVFFVIHNNTETDDVLIGASSDIAAKVELHTHIESADGVMQMVKIEGGIALPAGEMHELARGGDHVMLMGLTKDLKDGDTFEVTLDFQTREDVTLTATVDNARKPGQGGMGEMNHDMQGMEKGHDHSTHANHSGHDNGAAVDQTGLSDPEAIAAVMKAQFDTPENPLHVDPIVVQGDAALASWAQGDKGGRALLRKGEAGWTIVLCGGEDLRFPAFLTENGVEEAESLSQMFNAEEERLGSEKVALSSSFEGVVKLGAE